ncbi:MAG TPA: ferritin-like domain-containing protein, partial [Kofleriaceae bacterium]|nr:ferritin-like domain-containing protein [Kofleriaceae bacterium]
MLLTREEMTFDFGGAKLDPVKDKDLLEWMFNQFLYGEVTGIQVGHWLYDAPDLEAAKFLARQSLEEMQHVDNFLRIMTMLGCQPKPAHPAVRFLSTGMMGGSWPEHVALEMAQGEGFVLQAFYAVIDTLDHKPTVDILKRAVKQEERHV